MFFGSKSIAGLDIGSSSVKLAELKPTSSGFKLLRYGYAPLPVEAVVQGSFMNSPAIANAIGEACRMAGFKGKDVATAVSGHAVIVKKIALPAQSNEELEESIRWEAEQYIPFDINEVHIDHQILQKSSLDGQMDVLLVAAKKDLIDDYRNVVGDAGLNLAIMDVDAFAVGNMYLQNYEASDNGAVALVDIGASVININVMSRGVPVFTRDITAGGNQYTEEIQKTLNVSFDEAERIKVGDTGDGASKDVVPQEVEETMREVSDTLIGEIQRSLDFYRATTAESEAVEKLVLCGGSVRVPGLTRLFEERIEMAVEIMDPFMKIDASESAGDAQVLGELSSAMGVAVGLATRSRDEK